MSRVNLENFNEQVSIVSDDEIGHLAGNFNDMLERIENLKEQVVEEQEDSVNMNSRHYRHRLIHIFCIIP